MQKNLTGKTVVVGMSGGVDSSVCALLLKKQGATVIGLHMLSENKATANDDKNRVISICDKLGIKCEIVDYKSEMQVVKDYFIETYKKGQTPNPCVICNREVKFKPFVEYVEKLNADFFATGHYAKIEHDDNKHYLKCAVDTKKDQSYFLCQLSQKQLSKALFPLGELTKDEVKKLAEENGLSFEGVKESQDICFLGTEKFKEFMNKNYPEKSGDIVDVNSDKVVGKHSGISKYTLGQRKGLGIGGGHGTTGESWAVTGKDIEKNIVYVCQGDENILYSKALLTADVNWIPEKPEGSFDCFVRYRHAQSLQQAKVELKNDNTALVRFYEKQRAISKGQYAVFYKDGYCLGGGVIAETYSD